MTCADGKNCPHCGAACDRESVDVGVGVIRGPWGCGAAVLAGLNVRDRGASR